MTNPSQTTTISTEEWRKYNILIVDDERGVLEEIENDLIFEGFSLFKATSGEDALKILDQEEVYVALCDQLMPNGMSGTQFLTEARKKQPYLIGIILSAFGDAEYLMCAINEAKAFHYLLKPWNKGELIERLTQALQFCHSNLLEQRKKDQEELNYTRTLLDHAVLELNQTQGDLSKSKETLRELTCALSAVSDVTSQLLTRVKVDSPNY